jgi:20S proteasome alpha/beta subunit
MMTYGAPMNLQVEGAVRKIVPLSEHAAFLFSGTVPDGEEVAKRARARMQGAQQIDVAAIAAFTAESYQELKARRIEETILRPLLGLTFAGFQQLVGQSASSQVLQQVLGMISQHNLQLDVMIAGIDQTGAHLFVVTHPGSAMPMDTVGYAAIGSGGMHAAIRLSLGRQSTAINLPETVGNVYEAKIASEAAPGVGKVTDIAVVNASGVQFFEDDAFNVLAEIHKERPSLNADDLEKLRKVCAPYEQPNAKP